jgi:glycosyltransferase involved in cell wall biosynthesis
MTAGSSGSQPRRVVYVIASMVVGGTQTHLLQVLRFLDRKRWQPHLFVLRDGGALLGAARELAASVETFGMHGTLRHPADVAGLLRLRKRLLELRPQLVHGYLLRGNFYGGLSARLARVPLVVTSKRGLHRPASLAERIAVRASNRLSDAITGNAPAVLDFTREVEGVRAAMTMIPSGIDVDLFDPDRVADLRGELGLGERPTVGTAITLRPRKGYAMLFEAFAEIRKKCPRAALLIAGVERLEGDPAELAARLAIEKDLILLGRRADMPSVLKTLDVFVLPSESEGMSNAVLEAMAMMRPVVATAVGGNTVVIEEGATGFLVAYPDASALARRVLDLFANRRARQSIGQAARARVVAQYSAAAMVTEIEALYDRLSAAKGEPGRVD